MSDNKQSGASMVNYWETSECAYTVIDAGASIYVLEPCTCVGLFQSHYKLARVRMDVFITKFRLANEGLNY